MQSTYFVIAIILLFTLTLQIEHPLVQRLGVIAAIALLFGLLFLINRRTEEMKQNEFTLRKTSEELSEAMERKDYIDSIIKSMVDSLIVTDDQGQTDVMYGVVMTEIPRSWDTFLLC